MNIPNYPTDNLYKFIAISGLLVSGYCAFFFYTQVLNLELQITHSDMEERINSLEQEALLKKLNFLEKRQGEESPTAQEIEEMIDRSYEVRIKGERVIGMKEELLVLRTNFIQYYWLSTIGIIGGLIASGFGFILWHVRVQKPAELLQQMRIQHLAQDSESSE